MNKYTTMRISRARSGTFKPLPGMCPRFSNAKTNSETKILALNRETSKSRSQDAAQVCLVLRCPEHFMAEPLARSSSKIVAMLLILQESPICPNSGRLLRGVSSLAKESLTLNLMLGGSGDGVYKSF